MPEYQRAARAGCCAGSRPVHHSLTARQTINTSLRIIASCVALLALAACGGGGGGNSTISGTTPDSGVSVVASQVIDSGGGTVAVTDASSPIAGTQVVIPAGALSSATRITIGQVSGATGLPADVLVAELGPTGTVFSVPVSVTLRYSAQYGGKWHQ